MSTTPDYDVVHTNLRDALKLIEGIITPKTNSGGGLYKQATSSFWTNAFTKTEVSFEETDFARFAETVAAIYAVGNLTESGVEEKAQLVKQKAIVEFARRPLLQSNVADKDGNVRFENGVDGIAPDGIRRISAEIVVSGDGGSQRLNVVITLEIPLMLELKSEDFEEIP